MQSPSLSNKRQRTHEPAVLFHADCVEGMQNLKSSSVDLVLADPPYGDVLSNVKWDETSNATVAFTRQWVTEAVRALRPGGTFLCFGSPERTVLARTILILVDELKMQLVQQLVWSFRSGGGARNSTMKKRAMSHEMVAFLVKPGAPHVFNAMAGTTPYKPEERATALAKGKGRVTDEALDRGKPPRTVLEFDRENSRSRERRFGKHPSMKPVKLLEHLLAVHCPPNGRVLVPFSGSGSELLAASSFGVASVGFESEPSYVAMTKRRFEGHGVPLRVHEAEPLAEEPAAEEEGALF